MLSRWDWHMARVDVIVWRLCGEDVDQGLRRRMPGSELRALETMDHEFEPREPW